MTNPEDLFAAAIAVRRAGNNLARTLNTGVLDSAVADADQMVFEDRCRLAQGLKPVHSPVSAFCPECNNVLDEGDCTNEDCTEYVDA